MLDNRDAFEGTGVRYILWIETHRERGSGLLRRISNRSCLVVMDDFPTGHPRHVMERARKNLANRLHAVDGCGVIPMSWTDKAPPLAHTFRRVVQRRVMKQFLGHLNPTHSESRSSSLWMPENEYSVLLKELRFSMTPLEWLWRVSEGGATGKSALEPLRLIIWYLLLNRPEEVQEGQ